MACLLLGGAFLVVRLHIGLHRAGRAIEALEVTQALEERVLEAQHATNVSGSETPPSGVLAHLEERDQIRDSWLRARAVYGPDLAAAEDLVRAEAEMDSLIDQAHQVILERKEARLAQDDRRETQARVLEVQAARTSQEVERHAAATYTQLTRLEEAPTRELHSAPRLALFSDILLGSGVAVLILLLLRFRRSRRARDKHLQGARLVEEMLEAYSRRLETMNTELEQVSLLKTQFLANTSHELLTPLNGIMGSLELLRDEYEPASGEQRELVDQAYGAAERLHVMIQDLLDLCRLEDGDLALHCRGIELGRVVERVLARHRAAIQKRGLTLLVIPPSGGWPRIQADSRRLEQVLQHLISNAIKFTEEGSIRITGRIEKDEGTRLRLEISDTGIGIPAEKLPQVFDLFSQADGSNTRRFGCTGMGLTLSQHLIRGMQGQIGIESDGTGRGTRAWITLPLEQDLPGAITVPGPGVTPAPEPGNRQAA